MDQDINTGDPLADGADVTPPDGKTADSQVASVSEILGEVLGKKFPSDEAALKAVKDTFSYVGEYGKVKPILDQAKAKGVDLKKLMEEGIQPKEVDTSKFVSRDEFERESFFSKSQLDENSKALLVDLKKAYPDKAYAEIMELPAFKAVYEKAKSHDETERSKSVLHTNPRLAQTRDKLAEAREAVKAGDTAKASEAAVQAVMDAFNL